MGFRLLQITCRDVTLWRLYETHHIVAFLPNRRHTVTSLRKPTETQPKIIKGKNMTDGYLDFDEYIRQGEPDKKEKASILRTAIGLQAVDGLKAPDYLKDTARKHIEGE